MHALMQETLSYFDELKYTITDQVENTYQLKQKRTGLTVELNFSVFTKASLPTICEQTTDKKLFFLEFTDVEAIGFEALESFATELGEHCSIVVLEDEFFEQSMKEMWMFLSIDPRDRDIFNDSKYYKAKA